VSDPDRWGLPASAVEHLAEKLTAFWEHYRPCFRTHTRDTSSSALTFWRGQLTMEDQRNFANIDRRVTGRDGQPLQHFMSVSPWAAAAVFRQIQEDIHAEPALQTGGMVILDESADVKTGTHSAGAGRQHNGHVGKIELSQVSTTLAYLHPSTGTWALVDGELFLPAEWFKRRSAARRAEVGIPKKRKFATKLELGQRMIERARAYGLPFDMVACDEFYGRSRELRAKWDAMHLQYAAQIPADTLVYLQAPQVKVPPRKHNGRPPTRWQVQSPQKPHTVYSVARRSSTVWQHAHVRHIERGLLEADFAVLAVWTITKQGTVRAEWLVLRRDPDGRLTYSLLNGPADTPAPTLIERSCWRYFTERTYQDAKSELGWDDFQARKYRAWEHEMALTAAATWFIAGIKLQWRTAYPRDPTLTREFELEVLPALSMANVRDLLMAAVPLPEMTPDRARQLVVNHLVNRARSTSSRMGAQREQHDSS
jgi:SRSO17 transposase